MSARTIWLVFLVVLGISASVLTPVAFALPASFSSSGPAGSGPSGGGGGGGRVAVNDLLGLERRRLTWTTSLVRAATDRTKLACDAKLHMCRAGSLVMVPPVSDSGYGEARPGYREYMLGLRSQVGLRNTCRVERDVLHSLDPSTGCWFSSTAGRGARWNEIHPRTPAGGMPDVQGSTEHLVVRIWRSCRLNATRDGFTTAGSPAVSARLTNGDDGCSTEPVYERTLAPNDGISDQRHYFRTRLFGGDLLFSSNSTLDAFHRLGQGGAGGILFADCLSRAWYPAGSYARLNDFCTAAARATGTSGSSYYQRCSANNLAGDGLVWSAAEMQGELNYRLNRRDRWWGSRDISIQRWIDARRAGNASVWPAGINTVAERNRLCADASQWLATRWHLPSRQGDRATATVRLSGVPGRLYLVQLAWLDSRQNVLRQDLQLVSSAAPIGTERTCDNPNTPAVERYPLGDARCRNEYLRTQPALGTTSFAFANAGMVGALTQNTVDAQPAFAEPLDDTEEDTSAYSLDLPRAAAVGAHITNEPRSRPLDNHLTGEATGLNARYRNLADEAGRRGPTHWPMSPNPDDRDVVANLTNLWVGGFAPLLNGSEGKFAATWGVRAANPTRAGKPDCHEGLAINGHFAPDPCSRGQHTRLEQTNTATVLWENRRVVGDWKTDGRVARRDQRLTCDQSGGVQFILPDGRLDECDPSRSVGDGYQVRDAYLIPPLAAGNEVELTGLLHQAADGVASVSLDGALRGNVVQAAIYSDASYPNRAVVAPEYVVGPGNGGTIAFCEPTISRMITVPGEPITVAHWHRSWGDSAYGPSIGADYSSFRRYYDAADWAGGELPGVGHHAGDVRWYRYRTSRGEVAYTTSKPKTRPSTFVGHGRSWWHHDTEDLGSHTLYRPVTQTVTEPNPACPAQIRAVSTTTGQQVTRLPEGSYVAVFKVTGPTTHSVSWGMTANLLANETMRWGASYRLDSATDFTTRWRSRAVG